MQVSETIIKNKEERRNEFWIIMTLKFEMQIGNGIMRAMFNNKTEVNIFLYFIVLILKLVVKINVIVHIKKARNYKSLFIKYVPYVLM